VMTKVPLPGTISTRPLSRSFADRAAGCHPGAAVFVRDLAEGRDPLGVDAAGDPVRYVVGDLDVHELRAARVEDRPVTLSHKVDHRQPLTCADARGRL